MSADVDEDCLVRWPTGGPWVDSGQGGLFAYLAYRDVAVPDRARVDVVAFLGSTVMPLPEALLRQLWAPPCVERPLELGDGQAPLYPWSRPLRGVLYLGSTPASLVHEDTGEHFQVRRTDLTREGDEIAHALDHILQWPGDILTFVASAQATPPLARWLAQVARTTRAARRSR